MNTSTPPVNLNQVLRRVKIKVRIIQGLNIVMFAACIGMYIFKGAMYIPVPLNYKIINYFLRNIW